MQCDPYIFGCTEIQTLHWTTFLWFWAGQCTAKQCKVSLWEHCSRCLRTLPLASACGRGRWKGEGGGARQESVKLQPQGAFYPSGTVQPPVRTVPARPTSALHCGWYFGTKRPRYKRSPPSVHCALQSVVCWVPFISCSVYGLSGSSEHCLEYCVHM